MKYTVIKDTREQQGWEFGETSNCDGMVIQTLKTGDYSLCGLEYALVIERKGTSGEFAKNILEKRFERELERMDGYLHPFMLLEFTMEDILMYPQNSGIPKYLWGRIKISKWFILKTLMEYEIKYKTKIILCGSHGKEVAASIFKRMAEMYAPSEDKENEGT